MRSLTYLFAVVAVVVACAGASRAQSGTANATTAAPEAETPQLTEVQKLQLQNLGQRIEIAQLKAQAAQAEFDRARLEIAQLVQALQVDGYVLDLQRLEYAKPPAPAKKETTKK